MNNKELITIIIPTYNSEQFIESCLDSVIRQTYTNWQIMIIDQKSTDNTISIIKKKYSKYSKSIQIYSNPKIGNIASSRNIGIRNARSNFLAFLDSDDIWLPNKLEKCIYLLGECDLVYHDALILKNDQKTFVDRSHRFHVHKFSELLTLGNPIITSSVICKKKILNKTIKFSEDDDLIAIEDYDLWINLAFDGAQFLYLKKPLCLYRHHELNISNTKFDKIKGLKKIFKKYNSKLDHASRIKADNNLDYMINNICFIKKETTGLIHNYFILLFSKLDFKKKINCLKKIIKLIIAKNIK